MPTDVEPNEYYRAWLEHNVGEQGVDWQWSTVITEKEDYINFRFLRSEDAIIFNLTWP